MIGETLGSYRIVDRLGAGGMGEVYLAQHTRIDRRAAIKVLLPELSHNQVVVDRFFAEARATSSIHHPGIVEILDCDVHPSGRAYIVMELLEGESLAGRLGRDPGFGRRLDLVLAVTQAVADAVAAAHAKGIVHRDLKPDNIFLAKDARARFGFVVKILDFGIAKLMGGDDEGRAASLRTGTGSLLGTPAYMSPEQCRGASRVDHRTDIYSLGCIVYEMLAGQRPFAYEGFGELISAHLTETPRRVSALAPDANISPAVEAWLARLLAKSPADRIGSMADVSASIEELRLKVPTLPGTAIMPVAPSATATAVLPGAPATPASAGGTVLLPAAERSRPTTTTLSSTASERDRAPAARPSAARWAAIGAGALVVIGIGFAVARMGSAPGPAPATAPAVAVPAAPAVMPPPAPPPPPVPPPPAPAAAATIEADAGAPAPRATAKPEATPARADEARKRRPRAPRPAELSDDARKL